ncbi:MAG: AAA family ATPase [Pseudomonadales bacterium]|nr:AAA family ATPase [Pseudomonadales bacterium]
MSDKQSKQFNHRGQVLPDGAPASGSSGLGAKSQEQFQQYLVNYRFERDPFSDVGARGLFFAGGGRKEAVESLLHYSRYGSTPVFLTGHIGCGKTTTLKALISELENDVDVAVVPAVLMVTPSQFFMAIASGFGLDSMLDDAADFTAITQQLLAYFKDNAESERQSFLCIDNIQDLPTEVVNILFELLAYTDGGLGVLFVGEQSATAMLESAAEKNDLLLNRIELPVFDQHDVSAYVKYRLDAVGYGGEFPLTHMQLQALSYRSQGSLTQLHSVARSMLMAGMDSVKAERKPFPLPHMLALIFLTILIVIGWRHEKDIAVVPEPEPIILAPAASGYINGRDVNAADMTAEVTPDIDDTADTKTANQVRAALDALASDVVDKAIVNEATINQAIAEKAAVDKAIADQSTDNESIVSDTQLADMPASVVMAASNVIAESNVIAQSGAIETSNSAEVSDTAVAPQSGDKVNAAHKRLMVWSDVGYALQIFGTHNAKRAKQLVNQYFGEADLLYYETRYNGRPWYVVVNGPYKGRAAAKLSIEQLPEGLQRLRPWPRNIASIQADIRRFSAAIAADQ